MAVPAHAVNHFMDQPDTITYYDPYNEVHKGVVARREKLAAWYRFIAQTSFFISFMVCVWMAILLQQWIYLAVAAAFFLGSLAYAQVLQYRGIIATNKVASEEDEDGLDD